MTASTSLPRAPLVQDPAASGFDSVPTAAQPGMRYVLVLPVERKTGRLVMVEKTKPAWQAGRLNYPGGKLEEGETPRQAAVRELQEETGLVVASECLAPIAVLKRAGDFRMHVFSVDIDDADAAQTLTEEETVVVPLMDVLLGNRPSIENVGWLALMALDGNPTPKLAEIEYF